MPSSNMVVHNHNLLGWTIIYMPTIRASRKYFVHNLFGRTIIYMPTIRASRNYLVLRVNSETNRVSIKWFKCPSPTASPNMQQTVSF